MQGRLNTTGLNRRQTLFIGLTLAAVLASPAQGQQDSRRQLEDVRQNIDELQQTLGQSQKKRDTLQRELTATEQKISSINRSLRKLKKQLKSQQGMQSELNREAVELSTSLEQHRRQLSQHIRASYSAGQQQMLKLLLNQTSPTEMGRILTYYRYFTKAQLETVQATQLNLTQLKLSRDRLKENGLKLASLQREQQQQQQQLEKERRQRKALLSQLDREIRDKNQRLEELVADEKRLMRLLDGLELEQTPPIGGLRSNLARLKRKLKWPAQGKLLHRFGAKRQQGRLKWQGVFIRSNAGKDVHAIAPGRVVFADWIRGYGLMIIVDHGYNYLSIYGHNENLYKDLGDEVAARETIASVGNSGGQQEYGLYFELRHKGKPLDPAHWCR